MLQLLATLMLLAPVATQDDAKRPDVVEQTIAALEAADKAGELEGRLQAIRSATSVVDVKVITALKSGLRDRDPAIKSATIEAFRFMRHPESLEALHGLLKRDKKLRKDSEAFANLIRAVGEHGHPDSIDLLVDNLFAGDDYAVIRARIAALGNIRDTESVEALFRVMKSGSRKRVQPFMKSLRISLMVLTGADQGESQDLWHTWWNKNKKTLTVAEKAPRLPQNLQRQWDSFWGREREYKRNKKRGERGNDPEK